MVEGSQKASSTILIKGVTMAFVGMNRIPVLSRREFVVASALAWMQLPARNDISAAIIEFPDEYHLSDKTVVADFLDAFDKGWLSKVSSSTSEEARQTPLYDGRMAYIPNGDASRGGMLALSAFYFHEIDARDTWVSAISTYSGISECHIVMAVIQCDTNKVLYAARTNGSQRSLEASLVTDVNNGHVAIAAVVFDNPRMPILCQVREAVWGLEGECHEP